MTDISKKKLIKAELPGGFRDYGPKEAIWKNDAMTKIRTTFERFGFDPIETPAVERTEVLTGGEEDSGKIIFNIKGSRDESQDATMSLRFDLTIPLARFLAENTDIPKPFKRYQIGEVFRGESPQAGRYREFTQVDADIVGSSAREAEAELFLLLQNIFSKLGVSNYKIKINSRKLLNNLPKIAGFTEEKLWPVLRIIDKKDKIGTDGIIKELENELSGETAKKVKDFLASDVQKMPGGEELQELPALFETLGVKNWEINLSLVRGLSYYTGIIFEVILTEAPEIGSIASGGRYDNLLANFTGQPIPAVGISIGIDRLYAGLEKLGRSEKRTTNTQVLVFLLEQSLTREYFGIAESLRNAGINTALYLGEDRAFQAQLAYAIKKDIPYVVIMGESEKAKGAVAIKNLATREQKEVSIGEIAEYFKE
ncbi:MAG: histidine--tRNA ligase [Candidatus Sungbacteria bacterium]|nr:histidine--tRNA ligase [Candidatus Sungbacteria bacterium]